MKKIYLHQVLPLLFGLMLLGCSKEEVPVIDSSKQAALLAAAEQYAVSSPYDEGTPGVDPSIVINLPTEPECPTRPASLPAEIIDNPTQEYKNETTLLDISQLENHKTYHKVQNDKLSVAFFDTFGAPIRALKLQPGAEGWNSEWGKAPQVESSGPEVLYIKYTRYLVATIYLSKPCTEFGLEIAPDHQNYDHLVEADFGLYFYGGTGGNVWKVTKSPSGARLVALKSKRPFTTVSIWQYDGPSDPSARAFAIANIRYKLAE